MLEVSNLAVDHGPLRALWDVSFRVGEGERVALLGANGAGKSTTLGALVGLYRAAEGTILYRNQPLNGRDTADMIEDGIALVPEGRRLFPDMTVRENLQMGALSARSAANGDGGARPCLALFPVLREKAGQPAGQLSGGQQQMVAIGRALMTRPRLLLLDEPFLGVAPIVIDEVMAALGRLSMRALPSCWSSKIFGARWTSSSAPMSSRTAEPSSTAPGSLCWEIRISTANFLAWSDIVAQPHKIEGTSSLAQSSSL